MTTLLVFEFPFSGPWSEEMAGSLRGLAEDIAGEPGLIWKVWTEAPDQGVAGGVYLFEDLKAARAYTAKHSIPPQGIRDR
jgi:Putative mono-oxygenase ydhR